MQQIIALVAFAAVAAGSFADVKMREVPDWLNYGLLAFGIGSNAILSIAFWDWTYLAYSLLGFLVFLAIAYMMFYAGQWGGGDSKMLIALGAVFGLPFSFSAPFINFNSFLVSFWFNFLFVGVVYALLWSVFLSFRNRTRFVKEARSGLRRNVRARRFVLLISVAMVAAAFFVRDYLASLLLAALALLFVMSIYLPLFSKAVERAGMLRTVKPSQLTEGDWIAKDVIVAGRRITGPKDLGISKKQITQLKRLYRMGKVRNVLIKVGIPFVPSFLLSFIITFAYGNVFLAILGTV